MHMEEARGWQWMGEGSFFSKSYDLIDWGLAYSLVHIYNTHT